MGEESDSAVMAAMLVLWLDGVSISQQHVQTLNCVASFYEIFCKNREGNRFSHSSSKHLKKRRFQELDFLFLNSLFVRRGCKERYNCTFSYEKVCFVGEYQ